MVLSDLQPEPIALLDALIARAAEVVDERLLALVAACIEHTLADGPAPPPPTTPLERDVVAATDELVRRADGHFPAGALADLVTAAYAIEARTRLHVAAARIWDEA